MTDDALVDAFHALFAGREDVYGAVHGECVKAPITRGLWHDHLYGRGSLGVYPLVPRTTWSCRACGPHPESTLTWCGAGCGRDYNQMTEVTELLLGWGCSDIDRGFDMLAMARNLWKALRALGIVSWVERTKGKGYHCFVFAEQWMDPAPMRHALLVAHQIAGVPPTEVNPKQLVLTEKSPYGNYVNLPYSRRFADEGKRVVLDIEHSQAPPMRLEDFVERASISLNPVGVIEQAASLYVPPVTRHVDIDGCSDIDLAEIVRKLNGLAFTIFEKGPLEGRDRSSTQARLAHLCRESGLEPAEALKIMLDADARWGKMADRPDRMEQLERMVVSAYSKV